MKQSGKQSDGGGKPGPDAARIKIGVDWEEAMKRALGKKRPAEGWPQSVKKGRKKKKTRD